MAFSVQIVRVATAVSPGPQPGDRCELYAGPPYTDRQLRGSIRPLETVMLGQTLLAAFTKNPGSGFAIRLLNPAGAVYARSNSRPIANNRLLAMVTRVTVDRDELAAAIPELPLEEGKTRIDRLTLDFVAGEMRSLGHATHNGVFKKTFSYDYRFLIEPIALPVWTSVSALDEEDLPQSSLSIETKSLKIDADRPRQEALLGILRPFIKRKIRKSVQRRFHEALEKRAVESASDSELPPVVTLIDSRVNGSESLEMDVGILADAP